MCSAKDFSFPLCAISGKLSLDMIRRYRQTKILATLGPAANTKKGIEELFKAGVDVFRLNFSHGTHADHQKMAEIIRELEQKHQRPAGILADLQGPKFRIGQFKTGQATLEKGAHFRFDLDETQGDKTRVYLPHADVMEILKPGEDILIDDGKLRLRVRKKGKDFLDTEIMNTHTLTDHKGFNVPGVILPADPLTTKDLDDLDAALEMGVDWIAQSFVQSAADVLFAKNKIDGRAALMAKIEKPSAVEDLEGILTHVDGVMIARGDLGVEMPPEDVPALQKKIVRHVRHAGKPVVVATQMLESMIQNARPTRAEASDVATAVYDGADAVMLSAETASGEHPRAAVEIMNRICERTEQDESYRFMMESDMPETEENASDAITVAAVYVARDIDAAVIVNYTTSGSTTLRTARQRPEVPVLCLTQALKTARRLMLSYGVRAIHVTDINSFAETVERAVKIVQKNGFAHKGDNIVLTAGVPFGIQGSTNVLRIAEID